MEMSYEISKLKCAYTPGKRIVLEIDRLDIPTGKINFIIGLSGIGKSTFLETLGMMNNTLCETEESRLIFIDPETKNQTDLIELWSRKDHILSSFRNSHYSFIFQNTNLMNNFTAFENVYVPQLIQGRSLRDVKNKTKEILKGIGLEEIKEKQSIHSLSIGQKQRLAFARAIIPDFSVLFCDEPTGNLDINNACNLMDMLSRVIYSKNRTAIIVSHDIDLAIRYADIIIYIMQVSREISISGCITEKEPYGLISDDSLYIKKDQGHWHYKNERLDNIELKEKLIRDLHAFSQPFT